MTYPVPSTDLQIVKGGQVHECVAGDAGDAIAVQIPMDDSRLAGVKGSMYICRARDCQGEHGIKGAASSDVKAGNCGEGLLDVVLSPPPSLAYLGRKKKTGGGSANQVGGQSTWWVRGHNTWL